MPKPMALRDNTAGRQRARTLSLWALAMAAAVVAGGVIFFINPATTAIYPRCPFYGMTRLYCPGCGSLRAMHQLLHGRVLAALHLNPLAVLCLPALASAAVSYAGLALARRALPSRAIPAAWVLWLTVALAGFSVVRNLPWEPWSRLAPPHVASGDLHRR